MPNTKKRSKSSPMKKVAVRPLEVIPDDPPPDLELITEHFKVMRRFILYRKEDVSGKSGTGIIAEGTQYSSGWCSLTWLSEYLKLEWVPSIAVIENVHGHGGRTIVIFEDSKEYSEHHGAEGTADRRGH